MKVERQLFFCGPSRAAPRANVEAVTFQADRFHENGREEARVHHVMSRCGSCIIHVVLRCLCGAGAQYYGADLGPLSELHHGVKGRVYAVDARTLYIKDFHFDGEGPGEHPKHSHHLTDLAMAQPRCLGSWTVSSHRRRRSIRLGAGLRSEITGSGRGTTRRGSH
ncbi:hypothetical protein EVAR_81460_1 [Eumeta japonica]|uniref:Uncharacterized protein n=1 Tax=Eumeta variegata TaxID=151549 RepID=A0A4C1W0V6_EUMVA|nr:hypothetical protein EVAR_81460_1 [Eumeta japonica]